MPIELSMYHQHDSTLKLSLNSQFSTHTHTHTKLTSFCHFSPLHFSPFPILETLAPAHPLESFRHFALVYLTLSLSLSLCLFPLTLTLSVSFSFTFSMCSLIFVEVKALQAVLRTRFRLPTSHPFPLLSSANWRITLIYRQQFHADF